MKYLKFSFLITSTIVFGVLVCALTANKTSSTKPVTILKGPEAIGPFKHNGGYDSLAEAMSAARYQIETTGNDLNAANAANDLRAKFSGDGLRLLVGQDETSAQIPEIGWRLSSVGRGEHRTEISRGEITSAGNRVEVRRTAFGLTEYFENTPDGIEQGFIFNERPNGDEAGASLSLTLRSDGDYLATADADGQGLTLNAKNCGQSLRYEKLKAWDADGTELTARISASGDKIRMEVDDAAAKYPLTIDPIFIQRQKLIANDGAAGNYFGGSVATSGDTAVIGAFGNNNSRGAAYIFVRSGTIWTQQAKLVAADGASGDHFGVRVAISGDTVVIGATADDIGQGSAYVFVRSGAVWTAEAKLTANDGAPNDFFGISVGVSSDTVVIGAYRDDIGPNSDQGSAYVFVRNGGAWTQQAKLTANDGTTGDLFGTSSAVAGSTIIVGSNGDDIGSNPNQGSAYIFVRNGTAWSQQAKLVASDGSASAAFGFSVDITNTVSGTIAVVGAHTDSVGGNGNQGSVYVFTRGQLNTWSQTQKLIAADGASNDYFGSNVSVTPITGSTIIIGARSKNIGSNSEQGAAYVFKRTSSVWSQQQKLTASDGASFDYFGISVAISGETVMIGSLQSDIGANSDQGATYTFDLSNGAVPFDFDGDGKADLSIFRPSAGQWYYRGSSNSVVSGFGFGTSTDKPVPVDFTGDGKADIAFFRPSTSQWYVLRSEDSTFFAFPFGASGDKPVPADYDGDGKADAAVFRPSAATWFILRSSNGGVDSVPFGISSDVPEPADYDGDGKADVGIYRPGPGQWWNLRSSNGSVFAATFGAPTDKPVPGDYTGDGKADVAFYRPSDGSWYVLRSEDFTYYAFPFGNSTDKPAPADFDGDGKFDAAVFRPSDTNWYINRSSGGVQIQQFGAANDIPLPGAFVP